VLCTQLLIEYESIAVLSGCIVADFITIPLF